jgi:GNAT superfamily N-acetyltransferase
MQVTVRRASVGDATALAGLRWRGLTESGRSIELDEGAFVDAFSAWVSGHVATHLPFLVEADGDVAGMAWLMVAERVPSPERRHRRCGDVQSVYVLPELRDRGIGAALLEVVLAEARTLELEHVTVHSSDGAVRFYQRAGFQHDQCWLRWEPE